jgi:uncharacterized protein GlcG (DUF336 family)
MPGVTLEQAAAIVEAALIKAREIRCHPMTIAVVDAGGCLVALKREDGSGNLRPDIASAKAWGAVGMGIGGRAMADRATKSPEFWASLNAISHGRIAPVPGGVLLLQNGIVVGAVGATGDVPDNDEACALAGGQKAGFVTEVLEAALGKQAF